MKLTSSNFPLQPLLLCWTGSFREVTSLPYSVSSRGASRPPDGSRVLSLAGQLHGVSLVLAVIVFGFVCLHAVSCWRRCRRRNELPTSDEDPRTDEGRQQRQYLDEGQRQRQSGEWRRDERRQELELRERFELQRRCESEDHLRRQRRSSGSERDVSSAAQMQQPSGAAETPTGSRRNRQWLLEKVRSKLRQQQPRNAQSRTYYTVGTGGMVNQNYDASTSGFYQDVSTVPPRTAGAVSKRLGQASSSSENPLLRVDRRRRVRRSVSKEEEFELKELATLRRDRLGDEDETDEELPPLPEEPQ